MGHYHVIALGVPLLGENLVCNQLQWQSIEHSHWRLLAKPIVQPSQKGQHFEETSAVDFVGAVKADIGEERGLLYFTPRENCRRIESAERKWWRKRAGEKGRKEDSRFQLKGVQLKCQKSGLCACRDSRLTTVQALLSRLGPQQRVSVARRCPSTSHRATRWLQSSDANACERACGNSIAKKVLFDGQRNRSSRSATSWPKFSSSSVPSSYATIPCIVWRLYEVRTPGHQP